METWAEWTAGARAAEVWRDEPLRQRRRPAPVADLNPVVEKTLTRGKVLGHRRVTDAYLSALAAKHGGRLVTFDARVALQTVFGAEGKPLTVIA